MQHRRKGALLSVTLLLTLAACGSGSDGAPPPAADQLPAATEAPAGDGLTEGETVEADTTEADTDGVTATDAPEPTPSEAPATEAEQPVVAEAEPTAEDAPEEPVVTDAPEAAVPAEPVVGGRLFAADVQPAAKFDGNPFPDLVVDDIGKDAKVNVANILPSDRPVLLWAWAPH